MPGRPKGKGPGRRTRGRGGDGERGHPAVRLGWPAGGGAGAALDRGGECGRAGGRIRAGRLLGDPRRFHPVAGFGRAAGAWNGGSTGPTGRPARCSPPGGRRAGAARRGRHPGDPAPPGGPGRAGRGRHLGGARRARRCGARPRRWPAHLRRAATCRRPGDRLAHLCGRDPSALDEPELARATVESVAENTSDAVVAPLVWGARRRPARACSATARSTRWTRWSATGRRATRGSAPPSARLDDAGQPGAVPADRGCSRSRPRPLGRRRRRAAACGSGGGTRDRPPEPQRRAVRGGDGRRARRPARRPQRLLRTRRGAAVPGRRPAPRPPTERAAGPAPDSPPSVGAAWPLAVGGCRRPRVARAAVDGAVGRSRRPGDGGR